MGIVGGWEREKAVEMKKKERNKGQEMTEKKSDTAWSVGSSVGKRQ